jgi:hypothetical protein
MHSSMYVIIGRTGDIETAVARALAPFDEARALPRYKVRLSLDVTRTLAEHYQIPRENRRALAKHVKVWTGYQGGLDQFGIFYWTTSNPDGEWDWYIIGGRWDGYVQGKRTGRDPFDKHLAQDNVVTTEELLASPLIDRLPHGLVTPTGQWIARSGVSHTGLGYHFWETKLASWHRQVRRMLKAFPGHRIVCVDIHC